jgi:hypothetical protein
MNPDATVRSATLVNAERNSEPRFRLVAESARRALANPRCQPLDLPLDKYARWRFLTITFSPPSPRNDQH